MKKIVLAIALLAAASTATLADTARLTPEQVAYALAQNGVAPETGAPPGSQVLPPEPGPAIGAGRIGAPTYVVPPAQSAEGGVIDVGQAFGNAAAPYINAAVNALILAFVGWIGTEMKKRWNISIDAGHRDALVRALQNQAGSLIADGLVKIENGKLTVPDTNALGRAAQDALRSIPDAAAHLGLTPDYVANRIVDMIPQIAAGAQMIAASVPPAAASPPAPAPAPKAA